MLFICGNLFKLLILILIIIPFSGWIFVHTLIYLNWLDLKITLHYFNYLVIGITILFLTGFVKTNLFGG